MVHDEVISTVIIINRLKFLTSKSNPTEKACPDFEGGE